MVQFGTVGMGALAPEADSPWLRIPFGKIKDFCWIELLLSTMVIVLPRNFHFCVVSHMERKCAS